MRGYSTRDAAELLDISAARVRSYARAGFLSPARGPRGEYRFSFQDIVLLRTAKELTEARIHPRRVLRALRKLKSRLPKGLPLSALRVVADGDHVVVHDRDSAWEPESGQVTFDFPVADLAERAAPMVRQLARAAHSDDALSSDDWYNIGVDLEVVAATEEAKKAYLCSTGLNPSNAEAHVNLGRLLHGERRLSEAEHHYRQAVDAAPEHPTALFNLGVVLEDQNKTEAAVEAYRQAIGRDPDLADAHYNLARLYERTGNARAAIRHLSRYRALTR